MDEFDELNGTMSDQDLLQSDILEAMTSADDYDEISSLLESYEELYGQDLFWKQASFDFYEGFRDLEGMEDALAMLRQESLGQPLEALNEARFHFACGRSQQALDCLNEVKSLDDSETALVLLHLKAYCALSLSEWKTAVEAIEDILLELEDAQSLVMAGACYFKLGNIERGREYIEKAQLTMNEEDLNWAADFLTNFDLADVAEDECIPQALKEKIEAIEENNGIVTLETLDTLAESKPEIVLSFAREMVAPGQKMTADYLMALCYEKMGNQSLARHHYRAVLNNDYYKGEESEILLSLKLISLEKLEYPKDLTSRHLLTIAGDCSHSDAALLQIVMYAGMYELDGAIEELLKRGWVPDKSTLEKDDLYAYNDYLYFYYFRTNQFFDAFTILTEMAPERSDISFLVRAANFSAAVRNSAAAHELEIEDTISYGIEQNPNPEAMLVYLLHLEMERWYDEKSALQFVSQLEDTLDFLIQEELDGALVRDYLHVFKEEVSQIMAELPEELEEVLAEYPDLLDFEDLDEDTEDDPS